MDKIFNSKQLDEELKEAFDKDIMQEQELAELIAKGGLVVGVEQDRNESKKMELVNIWKDEQTNILQLTAFLYQKAILKSNNIKIKYSYNYKDLQNISIIQSYTNYDGTITKTKYTFYNLPTNLAFLDIYKIESRLKNEK